MKRKELTPEQLERRRLRARKYYQKHREQILAHNREYYRQKGRAWHAERIRKYRHANHEAYLAKRREYFRQLDQSTASSTACPSAGRPSANTATAPLRKSRKSARKGLTLEDIKGGVSQPRNTVIANVFYRLELIESYGTGIQRMLESYAGSGFEPEFAPAPASFVVMLPNRNAEKNQADDLDLSREEKVLRLLTERGSISRKDVEQLLGCSSFPANQVLKLLLEQGRIVKTGVARGTKYILNTRD